MKKSLFYGSHKRNCDIPLQVRLARREKYEKHQSAPNIFKPRILGPSKTWKIFHTQKEAFEAAKIGKKYLHVFSFESECFQQNSGQRMFLVTSYEEFWHYYRSLKNPQRHHYEIIAEGSVCRLYFDLEFMKEFNPNRDGAQMTSVFITYVQGMLYKYWKVKCTFEDVLQLEASTEAKFSRHLIFHIKDTAFKDNIVMGHFVKHIISVVLYTVNGSSTGTNKTGNTQQMNMSQPFTGQEEALKAACVEITNKMDNSDSQGKDTIPDRKSVLSVKTFEEKKDHSILQMSFEGDQVCNEGDEKDNSKLDENHSDLTLDLMELDVNTTQEDIFNITNEHEESFSMLNESVREASVVEKDESSGEFLDVIGLTRNELKQILVKDKEGRDTFLCDLGVYTKNRNFRLYLSTKLNKNNPLVVAEDNKYQLKVSNKRRKKTLLARTVCPEEQLFLDSLISNVEYKEDMKILTFKSSCQNVELLPRGGKRIHDTESMKEGGDLSPYPEVDKFILTIISKGGVNGKIRRWLYFTQSGTIIYDIAHNRWCERIKRPHQSNNIMIVVVLPRGIYYQKCHDPECKLLKYKSPDYNLPQHIQQLYCEENKSSVEDFSDDTITDDMLLSAMEGINKEYPVDQNNENLCNESRESFYLGNFIMETPAHKKDQVNSNEEKSSDCVSNKLTSKIRTRNELIEDNVCGNQIIMQNSYTSTEGYEKNYCKHCHVEKNRSNSSVCCVENKCNETELISNPPGNISCKNNQSCTIESCNSKPVTNTTDKSGFNLFQNILCESPVTGTFYVDSWNSSHRIRRDSITKSVSKHNLTCEINDDNDHLTDEQLLNFISALEDEVTDVS